MVQYGYGWASRTRIAGRVATIGPAPSTSRRCGCAHCRRHTTVGDGPLAADSDNEQPRIADDDGDRERHILRYTAFTKSRPEPKTLYDTQVG